MPANFSAAKMGLPFWIDILAKINRTEADYAWFVTEAAKLDAGKTTKKVIYHAMSITPVTLDKYLLIHKLDKVRQHATEKEATHAQS